MSLCTSVPLMVHLTRWFGVGVCQTIPIANRYGSDIRFEILVKMERRRKKERKSGREDDGKANSGLLRPSEGYEGAPIHQVFFKKKINS